MKFKVLLASLATTAISVHAVTIAQWTFETSVPTTAGPIAPEVGSGTATGSHASGSTTYSNPAGNGSTESWSSDRWVAGDYYQFQISTIGYKDISLSWNQSGSATGPGYFGLFWSLTGISFTQFGSDYAVTGPAPAWSSLSSDLSTIPALNNASSIYFRLVDQSTVSVNGGTVATGGTDRVDDFTVSALRIDTVPDVGASGILLGGSFFSIIAFRRFTA